VTKSSVQHIADRDNEAVSSTQAKSAFTVGRALKGDGVVITRHGKPVAEFKPVPAPNCDTASNV
jgi:antitoxin (DNA-binding transcriptional repressor) of toxin-antitoxin stability system